MLCGICKHFIYVFCALALFHGTSARAEAPLTALEDAGSVSSLKTLTPEQRKKLAHSFLTRMKTANDTAERFLTQMNIVQTSEENLLPEGEMVLMQPVFPSNIYPEGLISGTVRQGKILLSMLDFASVLQIPIEVNAETQTASGWYIRKNKEFFLDMPNKTVQTDIGRFNISDNIIFENGDIFVEVKELAKWLDFEIKVNIANQEIHIKSPIPLPFQERYARRKQSFSESRIATPELPRRDEKYKPYETPFVDVATNSSFRHKSGEQDPYKNHNVNIRTTGDLAYGTVTTQALLNNRDQLTSFRANYKKESDQPDLLGKLNARKFEVGDVTTARLPIGAFAKQELGARISNIDPNKGILSPTTAISGTAFPGWDVELYRENQLVGFQEVGEDGFYQFDQINLFQNENKFRVVFYGPQGEVVEENVFVPVDPSRLAEGTGAYDVSLTLNDKATYTKQSLQSQEENISPNLFAYYERYLGAGTSGSVSLRSTENNDKRDTVAGTGIVTTALETLVNADVAIDDEGDVLTELAARRSFGEHDFSNKLTWTDKNFDSQSGGNAEGAALNNYLNLSGPMFHMPGITNPQYFASSEYSQIEGGDATIDSSVGLSGAVGRLTFSEEIRHQSGHDESSGSEDGNKINSITNISGTYGKNRLRVGTDYKISPDSELVRVLANYHRYVTKNVDLELDWTKNVQQSFSEYTARLDWQAGFVRISPRISYNTEQEFFAGLSTRFGLLREPHTNEARFFDRNISSNGGISAFVFLDRNGDSVFGEGDEPLQDVIVQAPQNGGREKTDEKGIALFYRMSEARLTDVFLDGESLQDPSWVPGFKGVSILPRAGHVATIDFPVHIAGELDGSVFVNGDTPLPLKNISISLYNAEGKPEQVAITDQGGFYYFTRIPPGRYLLIVDEKSARRGNFIRPEPQAIEIGYDGTVLYGNDIFVDAGEGDVPSVIMADLEDYKARHPQINFSEDNYDLVLNLGDYNSNLLMSVIWYKIKTRYAPMIGGGEIFVPPTESYADLKTGKHTLRVGLRNETIDEAYNRCRALMAREQFCKVEIYPAYMKQANAEASVVGQ